MKIHHRLALLLLTAGLAACGSSDLGGSKGDPLTSTGVVITSEPVTAPTAANKATVGFRVIFPEPAGAVKAALNPAMTRVTITTAGVCGVATLELSPTVTSGIMTLKAGECTFTANAFDSFNAKIESSTSQGTLLAGPNNVSLTFLGGPWLFVDPATNVKSPITLVGGEVLSGINISPTNGALRTRWFGPDLTGDGPTSDDILGGTLISPPELHVTGTFSGGTGAAANLVRIVDGKSNLTDYESSYAASQRVIQILGVNPNVSYPKTFTPTNYTDYFTSKVIDGTTLEGNIAEFTVDSHTLGTPYGTCTATAATAARATALNAALGAVRKAAATSIGAVTVNWTECVEGLNVDVTDVYSNVNVHPFRAESSFADPASAMQVQLNNAIANYKKALDTEDAVNGLDLTLLRKAASQFVTAVGLAGVDNLTNTADTARFFGAISRLAALGVDTVTDGVADGLNDFNDVLDALGVPPDAESRNWSKLIKTPESCVTVDGPYPYLDCTPNLPTTAPRSGEILTLLDSKLNTQLDLAIADLSRISAGFTYDFVETSGATTNFDYGDALALTAIAHGIKAELAIDMAYDLDLDIAATINGNGPASVQAFLDANPNVGKLAPLYATELAQAKIDLQTALTTLQSAIDEIAAEGTGVEQETEFISFYTTDNECIPNGMGCTWTEVNRTDQELFNARDTITKALAGLNGPITVDNRNTFDTSDDVIIDPTKFFAGISFRDMLPGFTGDTPQGLFFNPTMNGLLVQGVNINEDLDGNSIPDLLEDEQFYPALVSGNTFSGYTWLNTGGDISWAIEFVTNADGSKTVTANWNYWTNVYPSTSQTGTATGEWSILPDGSLQINFAADTAPSTITGMNLTLEDIDQLSQSFDAKVTLTFADASTMTNWSWWQNMTPPAATGDATIK